jgi:hypothetical protein
LCKLAETRDTSESQNELIEKGFIFNDKLAHLNCAHCPSVCICSGGTASHRN